MCVCEKMWMCVCLYVLNVLYWYVCMALCSIYVYMIIICLYMWLGL